LQSLAPPLQHATAHVRLLFLKLYPPLIEPTVLNDWTALYLSAQTSGNPSLLTETLFPNLTYTEQFTPKNISSGILSKPLNISQYRSVLDEALCTSFTEIIVTEPSHPYVYTHNQTVPKTLLSTS
jgi:hypothetical protein